MTVYVVIKYEATGVSYPVGGYYSYTKAKEVAEQHSVGRNWTAVLPLEIE